MNTVFKINSLLASIVLMLSGCGTVHHDNVYLSEDGRPVATSLSYEQKKSIENLTAALKSLDESTSNTEAASIAYDAVVYPLILSNQYGLTYPPQWHNVLVNRGQRPRGLCFQWAEDMTAHMRKKNLQTFDIHRGTAFRWTKDEHNSLIISAKGDPLEEGIVLDPWRNSGTLFWSKVKEDKTHPWVKFGTVPKPLSLQ